MIDYNKKRKEHLFLVFLLGGIFNTLDSTQFEIGSFIGGGLGMMVLSVLIGYIIHFIVGTGKSQKKDNSDDLLDSSLITNNVQVTNEYITNKLRPFKYAVYIALFFVCTTIINLLFQYFSTK